MEIDSYISDKQKRRRKKRRYGYTLLAVIVVYLLAIAVIWFVLHAPLFRVGDITITGNRSVPAGDVATLLQSSVLSDHNFWRSLLGLKNMLIWPHELNAKELALVPQLASISIEKDYWTHTITATVAERQPFAIWCFVSQDSPSFSTSTSDESCYWFDDQGVLFGKTFDTEGSLLFSIHDYSQTGLGLNNSVLPAEFLPNLISIVNVIRESGITVREIALKDIALEELDVTTYNGPDLYFSLRFPADDDLSVLQELMTKPNFGKLQYVDFTVENRAYYK